MPRRVFFSFHYQRDIWRINVLRNCFISKVSNYEDSSLWQKEDEKKIKLLIDSALADSTVTVVLIGTETAQRRWVKYEIQKSLELRNGMLGIHIHNVRDLRGRVDFKGMNPFDDFTVEQLGQYTYISKSLIKEPKMFPVYDWLDDDGYTNLGQWIDEAARAADK